VLNFLKIAFSAKVFEGYGQTETTGASFLTNPEDGESGHVGGVVPHNEFKLVDVDEMDYRSTDEIDGVPHPRGEICFRGPCCFTGYFKNEEKTKETIDENGFVHSGDIGVILPNGGLKIIDRKKNIFKLAQGEYIAAEKLEIAFTTITLIKQTFIYGDSLQGHLVAIFVPDKDEVEKWAESKDDITIDNYDEFINSEEFHNELFSRIKEIRGTKKLTGLEVPKKLYCTNEEFSVENSLLTPTFKLKRNEAKKKYLSQIKEMYGGAKLQGEEM
jgi:long-chain acyl-CoA synthetase